MASKAQLIPDSGPMQPSASVEESELPAHEQEVRVRGYEIYLERGAQSGFELDDWLQAEQDLSHNRPT